MTDIARAYSTRLHYMQMAQTVSERLAIELFRVIPCSFHPFAQMLGWCQQRSNQQWSFEQFVEELIFRTLRGDGYTFTISEQQILRCGHQTFEEGVNEVIHAFRELHASWDRQVTLTHEVIHDPIPRMRIRTFVNTLLPHM